MMLTRTTKRVKFASKCSTLPGPGDGDLASDPGVCKWVPPIFTYKVVFANKFSSRVPDLGPWCLYWLNESHTSLLTTCSLLTSLVVEYQARLWHLLLLTSSYSFKELFRAIDLLKWFISSYLPVHQCWRTAQTWENWLLSYEVTYRSCFHLLVSCLMSFVPSAPVCAYKNNLSIDWPWWQVDTDFD